MSGSDCTVTMPAKERREAILRALSSERDRPLSASHLAARFSVSRQVIVGDIALLRCSGVAIDATARGYRLPGEANRTQRRQVVCVHDSPSMVEELYCMVDAGCTVEDVQVAHPIYGTLTGELHLSSRYDVDAFSERVRSSEALPLSALTEGIHTHTLLCPSEEAFGRLLLSLREKGFLVEA